MPESPNLLNAMFGRNQCEDDQSIPNSQYMGPTARWVLNKTPTPRRFPVAIQPRRIMQVQAQVRRKKKIEEDRKKRIAEWLAIEMFGEPGRCPWWRRWL